MADSMGNSGGAVRGQARATQVHARNLARQAARGGPHPHDAHQGTKPPHLTEPGDGESFSRVKPA